MSVLICSDCSAENTADAKFCNQCGVALTEKKDDRFKTFVAVLIAVVSLAGALLAWRIAALDSLASDDDVQGIVSLVSWHQARVGTEADMYRNLRTYLKVRIHDALSNGLARERDLYPNKDPNRTRLWDEGWTETFVAEEYLDQVTIRPEYIRADGSYDGQAAQDIDMAGLALTADFDPQGRYFAEADGLRLKTQRLTALALFLSTSLLFYTLAEVVTHPVKYVFVILGSGVFLLFGLLWPAIEWLL